MLLLLLRFASIFQFKLCSSLCWCGRKNIFFSRAKGILAMPLIML